jgi:hypothetical protein
MAFGKTNISYKRATIYMDIYTNMLVYDLVLYDLDISDVTRFAWNDFLTSRDNLYCFRVGFNVLAKRWPRVHTSDKCPCKRIRNNRRRKRIYCRSGNNNFHRNTFIWLKVQHISVASGTDWTCTCNWNGSKSWGTYWVDFERSEQRIDKLTRRINHNPSSDWILIKWISNLISV